MDIGRDNGGVVDLSYEARKPFPFTGTLRRSSSTSSRTSWPMTKTTCTQPPTTGTQHTRCPSETSSRPGGGTDEIR